MTETSNRLNREGIVALRGIRLPAVARKQLRASGIYCQPAVSIEFQREHRSYVLRGVESGGAVSTIGAYCGFASLAGARLPWLQRVESVGVNGQHAIVVVPNLTRLHMFRSGNTCELLITAHELAPTLASVRPLLRNSIIFRGRNGTLGPLGSGCPEFLERAGDPMPIPAKFYDAVLRTVEGLCCCGCSHAHVLGSPPEITTSATASAWNNDERKGEG